jgi:hypothetical protein
MPTVLDKTDDSITVTWATSAGQASYELYWDAGVEADDLQLLATTEESSYVVTGLSSGRSYRF